MGFWQDVPIVNLFVERERKRPTSGNGGRSFTGSSSSRRKSTMTRDEAARYRNRSTSTKGTKRRREPFSEAATAIGKAQGGMTVNDLLAAMVPVGGGGGYGGGGGGGGVVPDVGTPSKINIEEALKPYDDARAALFRNFDSSRGQLESINAHRNRDRQLTDRVDAARIRELAASAEGRSRALAAETAADNDYGRGDLVAQGLDPGMVDVGASRVASNAAQSKAQAANVDAEEAMAERGAAAVESADSSSAWAAQRGLRANFDEGLFTIESERGDAKAKLIEAQRQLDEDFQRRQLEAANAMAAISADGASAAGDMYADTTASLQDALAQLNSLPNQGREFDKRSQVESYLDSYQKRNPDASSVDIFRRAVGEADNPSDAMLNVNTLLREINAQRVDRGGKALKLDRNWFRDLVDQWYSTSDRIDPKVAQSLLMYQNPLAFLGGGGGGGRARSAASQPFGGLRIGGGLWG